MITVDLNRYMKYRGFPNPWRVFIHAPGFRFMVLYRLCNKFKRLHPVGLISRIWYKRLQVKFGIQIPFTTQIGDGLFLGHFGSIVINSKVVIGRNCNVAQGVTIGQINIGDKKGCPKIGDRVWIGANAVVVGNIEIGDDVLIAPLSYVNFSVPAKSVVMGNPAKIVSDKGSEGYVNVTD